MEIAKKNENRISRYGIIYYSKLLICNLLIQYSIYYCIYIKSVGVFGYHTYHILIIMELWGYPHTTRLPQIGFGVCKTLVMN